MNIKERYDDEIERMKLNNEKNDLIEILKQGINSDKLYNALRSIYLIAFNSKPINNGDNNKVQVVHQFSDMDNAVVKIKELILEYDRNNFITGETTNRIESCLNLLKKYYTLSATNEEINSKSGMVKNENYNNQICGVIGTYYNFNDIPNDSWVDIKKYIMERI
ncbi:hypothetical protein [Clostridium akagii]|uniref:hypothetical protein n=1 Tax=Clostridium akagii TaxID=91623 RepID=UPI00047C407D|nr:hypothetical protein [Clostridium akagii]